MRNFTPQLSFCAHFKSGLPAKSHRDQRWHYLLITAIMFMAGFNNLNAQLSGTTASGCTSSTALSTAAAPACNSNQSLVGASGHTGGLGAGEAVNVPLTQNAYYTITYTNNTQSSGVCIGGTHYTNASPFTFQYTGATGNVLIGPYRNSVTWTTTSATLQYMLTKPSETSAGAGTYCASGGNVTNTPTNGTSYWQGTTSGGTSTTTAATSELVTSSGTYYYNTDNAGCWSGTTAEAVTVDAAVGASISGGTANVCYNSSPGTFTASGSGGSGSYTYLWYNNGSSTGITTNTYSPGNLTSSSTFYCAVTSGSSCGTANTTNSIVNVYGTLSATISGGSSPICYNSAPGTYTATGSGGTGSYSYLWYLNGAATGVTTNTYAPGNLTTSSTIYCAVTSGSCGTVPTSNSTVTVYPNFTASQSGGSSPICYNSTPSSFTASGSGGTGSYTYLWYNNGSSTGVTTNTYSPGNLTSSSTIYCSVTSGSCGTVPTTAYPVTVDANLTATQSGGSSPLCYNAAPGTFTANPSGGTGSYTYSWYINGSASGITTNTYAPGNLTSTSTIYCSVSSGSCGTVPTTASTITVYGNLTASQNAGSSPICYSTSPGTFTATATGGPGSYTYQWYTGAGAISGATNSTYNPGNITSSTTYHCSVTSGGCGTVGTTASAITVYPVFNATISGGTSPSCYSTSPGTFTATASGGNGSYSYQWYNSSGSIASATSSTYTAPVLTSSNSYYCSVTSGAGCGTVPTGTTAITIEPPVSSYGTVSASGGLTQTVCDNVPPNSGNPLVVSGAAGSSGSFTYQWYYQSGLIPAPTGSSTSGWTACTLSQGTGYNTNSFIASGSSSNITFACFVIPASPVCGSGQWATNDVQVTVLTTGPQESATGAANVCLNGSVLLSSNLSVVIPATYQWYSSTSAGFGSPTTIAGATSTTYAPPTSASGTLYYEIIATFSGSGCNPATSNIQNVTVYTVPSATQSGGTSPICYNTSPGTFTATASGGSGNFTYQWYNSVGSVASATSSTFNPGNLVASDAFNCTVTDAAGCGVISTPATSITVDANLTAAISGGTTPICYNTSPGTFTATAAGGTGTYTYQWFNGSGSVAGATSSTYNPGNITASNSFFCAVTSGSCGTVNTPVKNITVHANLTANITGGTSPLCYNTAPGTIRTIASGGSGTYTYQWYNSSGAISGATSSTYAPGNLLASDSYYCNVVGGTCGSVNTSTVSITVYANLAASISGGTTPVCYNTSPGTFTATGTGGNGSYTYQWYNGAGSIAGATASTYSPGNITTSDSYLASVNSGSCGTVATSSSPVTVDANLTASISGGTSPICYNTDPGVLTVTGSGGTGSYTYQWYNGAGSISGATTSTYDPGSLIISDSYHASVTSGSCGTVSTSSTAITVDGNLTASISGGISPICYNTNPGTFTATATGGTGAYTYQWYNSSGSIVSATASTYSPGNITAGNSYHCSVTSGSCGTVSTSATPISVYANLTASISGGSSPICYNSSPGIFTATGAGGDGTYAYQWYNTSGSISGATGSVYQPGNLTAANAYHCVITSGSCGSANTSTTSISVYSNLTATISGGTSPVCYNASPGTFTATAAGGPGSFTYQWYDNNGIISGATASSYAPGNLASSNGYYCAVTSGSCGTVNTSTTNISVDAETSATASNTGPYVVGQTISLSSGSAGATGYSWSGPLGYSSTTQNPTISGSTTGMTGTYTVTATNASGCTATASTSVTVATTASYTWTGANSTDWTDAGNWSPTAPLGGPNACAIDVTIPSVTNSPVINSAVQVGNLDINGAAQLTLNGANISVCKNFAGGTGTQATITGTGILVMNGGSLQTITGKSAIQELTLSNSAGASMQSGSELDIYTSLDLASGNFNATNGTLTFKSAAVNSVGIIDNFSSGYTGTITGNINAERYYAQSVTYDQHYMGSPVNSPALSQFNASGTSGFVIDPWCDETRLVYNSPYGTVFSFHESHGATCGLQQWKVETSGNAQNGVGYSVVRAGTGTLVLNGAPNLNASYSVSGLTNSGWSNTTVQNHTENSGWQLVSNPYLATLNISSVPTGFDSQIQVWNAEGPYAGSYQPGTVGNDATVAPFQAFMVHKTSAGGTATFTMNGTDRVRGSKVFFLQNANQLNIVATNVANGMLDQTTVAFNQSATDTFDSQIDAAKFAGALNRHTLYTVNDGKWMSRNVLHDEATTSTVPMGFEPGANGTYKLTFNGLNTFDPTSYIYLEDKTMNVMYNLRNGDYIFSADSADDWNRFVLHFTPAVVVSTNDASCTAAGTINIQQPGSANWNYTLTDNNNAIITSGTLNQSQQVAVGVAAGSYTLTLIDTNSYTVTKTIIVNGPEMVTAGFQANSDAVQTGQTVTLTASSTGSGNYQWNFGNGLSASGVNTTVSYTQPGVYTVSLVVTNQSGCSATQTQTITVTSADATGISNINNPGNLKIWSHNNLVYVDFTDAQLKDASVTIYDILGQEISNDKVVNNVVYEKQINSIEAAYMIVMVRNNNEITTKKVFIINSK